MKKLNYLLRGIPGDLWRKTKILAANRGTTIRQLILDLLDFATQKIK